MLLSAMSSARRLFGGVRARFSAVLAHGRVNRFPNGREPLMIDHPRSNASTLWDYLSQFLRIHSPALNTVMPMAARKYSIP